MDEEHHEEHHEHEHKHEEHPGCKCGGVCRITGACGKHELRGEEEEERVEVVGVEEE